MTWLTGTSKDGIINDDESRDVFFFTCWILMSRCEWRYLIYTTNWIANRTSSYGHLVHSIRNCNERKHSVERQVIVEWKRVFIKWDDENIIMCFFSICIYFTHSSNAGTNNNGEKKKMPNHSILCVRWHSVLLHIFVYSISNPRTQPIAKWITHTHKLCMHRQNSGARVHIQGRVRGSLYSVRALFAKKGV